MSLHSQDYVNLANTIAGLATVAETQAPAGTTGADKAIAVAAATAQALPTVVAAVQAQQPAGEDHVGQYISAVVSLLSIFSSFFAKKPTTA